MKILIASQAFKGTLTTFEANHRIEKKLCQLYPEAEFQHIPISDGGDGFLEVMLHLHDGEKRQQCVSNANGEKVNVPWGVITDKTAAVIELAQIAGLAMTPKNKQSVMHTTTSGMGEVILQALDEEIMHFYIGLGGSATHDLGVGIVQAMGGTFLDDQGMPVDTLEALHTIDLSHLDPRVKNATFTICCDVKNVMTGPEGAAYVYAPQKGASPAEIKQLESRTVRFVEVVKQQFGIDLNAVTGSGAAGGTAGGLHALLGAELTSGIDLVLDQAQFNQQLNQASLVVTGEGRMDGQTIFGKGPIVIAERAAAYGVPVWAYVGSLGEGYEKVYDHGITKVIHLS